MAASSIILIILLHGVQFGIMCWAIGAANKSAPEGAEQSLF